MNRILSLLLAVCVMVSSFAVIPAFAEGTDNTPKAQPDWTQIYAPVFSMEGTAPKNFTTNKINGYTAACDSGTITVTANEGNAEAGQIRIPFDTLGQGRYYVEMEYKTALNSEAAIGKTGDVTVNLGGYSSIERYYLRRDGVGFWKAGKTASYAPGQEDQWHRIGLEIDLSAGSFTTADKLVRFYFDGNALFDGASFPPGYASDKLNKNSFIFDFNAADFKNGESLSLRNFEIWQYTPQTGPTADEKLAADMEALTEAMILNGNPAPGQIRGNLNLPKTAGENGTVIAWKAEPEGIVNTDTGAVTRPAQDTAVTLTATGALEGAAQSQIKEFSVTVLKAEPADVAGRVMDENWAELTEEHKDFSDAENGISYTSDAEVEGTYADGVYTLKMLADGKTKYISMMLKNGARYKDSVYYMELKLKQKMSAVDALRTYFGHSSGKEPIMFAHKPEALGTQYNGGKWGPDLALSPEQWGYVGVEINQTGAKKTMSVYLNGEEVLAEQPINKGDGSLERIQFITRSGIKTGDYIAFDDFRMWEYTPNTDPVEPTADEKLAADMAALTEGLILNGQDAAAVTGTLNLVRSAGKNGTMLAWTAEPAGIVNTDTGAVTQPERDTTVTLRATGTLAGAAQPQTKEFVLAVKGKGSVVTDETPKFRLGWKLQDSITFDQAGENAKAYAASAAGTVKKSFDTDGYLRLDVEESAENLGYFINYLQIPFPETYTSGSHYAETQFMANLDDKKSGNNSDIIRQYLGSAMSNDGYAALPIIGELLSSGKLTLGDKKNTWVSGPKNVAYATDAWHKFGVEFNCDTEELRFYLDGVEIYKERGSGDAGKPLKFAQSNPMSVWAWAFYKNVVAGQYIKFKDFTFWSLDDRDFKDAVSRLTYESLSGEDRNAITKNLNLPTSFSYETGDVTVSWSSSNPEIIGADGAVRPNEVSNQTVTLTAVAEQASTAQSKTLTFTFTVLQKDINEKFVTVEDDPYDSVDALSLTTVTGGENGTVEISGGALNLNVTGAGELAAEKQIGAAGLSLTGNLYLSMQLNPASAAMANTFALLDSQGQTVLEGTLQNGRYTIGDVDFEAQKDMTVTFVADTAAGTAEVYANGAGKGSVSLAGDGIARIRYGAVGRGKLAVGYFSCLVKTDDPDLTRVTIDSSVFCAEMLTAENPAYITRDLSLAGLETGLTGSTVHWSSSNESLISLYGVVTRPEEDTQVSLTASFTSGTEKAEKSFAFTVAGTRNENLAYGASVKTSSAQTGYGGEAVTDGATDTCWLAEAGDEQPAVTVTLKTVQKVSQISLNEATEQGQYLIKGFTLEVSEDNREWSTVYNGTEVGAEKLIIFDAVAARYIRFVVTEKEPGAAGLAELAVFYVPSDRECVAWDAEAIDIGDSYLIKEDLELPAYGANGTAITWSSSNEQVITSAGKVNRPTGRDVPVTLTAVVAKGDVRQKIQYSRAVAGLGNSANSGGSSGGGSSRPGGGISLDGASTGSPGNGAQASQPEQKPFFSDVQTDGWSYPYIRAIYDKGIISGDGNGRFNPEAKVTREEFVKMILLALELKAPDAENPFTDVEAGQWYTEYVTAANAMGIVKGVTDTTFGIGLTITRQDMAVILDRAMEAAGKPFANGAGMAFRDADDISAYAKESVAKLTAAKIIEGSGGAFAPKDDLTREQAAKVICLILEK